MKKERILGMAVVGVLIVFGLSACGTPATEQAHSPAPTQTPTEQAAAPAPNVPAVEPLEGRPIGRGLTLALNAETPSVAPARHTALIGYYKNELTHNGLVRLGYQNLEPILDLAESFTALSDTLFEFNIRQGVRFHNGDYLSAYDVAASLEYVRTYPETRSFHNSVVAWEVVDRYTIILDSGVPDARMLFDLSFQPNFIMPISLIEAGHDFQANPVGSGPFVFEEWRSGDFLTFRAFEDYFDTDRSPMIEYITWRIIPEGASRTIALETGEVDYVMDVSFPDIPRMEENPDITILQRPSATFQYFIFNTDRPQFQNVYVRHAIDMALDREAMLIASLDGFGIPIWTSMPPAFAGATTEGSRDFDPDGARALLAEHNVDPATLDFDMMVFNEEQRRRAEVAQSNLADIGITTTITMIEFATWLSLTLGDTFDTSFANFTVSNLPTLMYNLMHYRNIDSQNRARWNNPELSALIDQGIATIDDNARNAIFEEASRIANEDAGFVGTNMTLIVRAFNSNLVVPEVAANGSMFFNMVHWVD